MRCSFAQLPGTRAAICYITEGATNDWKFTWAKNPDWKEFYSSGEEIQAYVQRVIDTFDLRKYFLVNHQVIEAAWQDDEGVWKVKIKNLLDSNEFTDTAEVLINNEGLLKLGS